MSKFVLKNALVNVNSVDLSNRASKVTIETQFDAVDVTSFGGTYKEIIQGLGDAKITVDFFQDFAAAEVDATLWPLSQSGGTFPITVRPTNAAKSATNPSYEMTAVLLSYNPIDGGVGDASTTSVEFQNSSQTGLQRVIV